MGIHVIPWLVRAPGYSCLHVALHTEVFTEIYVVHVCMTDICRSEITHDTCNVHVCTCDTDLYNFILPYSTKFSLDKNFAQCSYFVLAQKFRQN